MTARVAYAFKGDDGKLRLSAVGPKAKWKGNRPANVYETQQDLLRDAAKRKVAVEWEDGSK